MASSPRDPVGREPGTTGVGRDRGATDVGRPHRRHTSTETKAAFKTTELIAYVVVLIAVLVAGLIVDKNDGGTDNLVAHQVWLYVAILTVGYMISRGLAKSGSREPYDED